MRLPVVLSAILLLLIIEVFGLIILHTLELLLGGLALHQLSDFLVELVLVHLLSTNFLRFELLEVNSVLCLLIPNFSVFFGLKVAHMQELIVYCHVIERFNS